LGRGSRTAGCPQRSRACEKWVIFVPNRSSKSIQRGSGWRRSRPINNSKVIGFQLPHGVMSPVSRLTKLLILMASAVFALAVPARSSAATDNAGHSGTVELDHPAYTAHEYQGYLTITIVRTGDLSVAEHVGYGVKQQDGRNGIDFAVVNNTYITMQPGQSTYSFQVRIIDQGVSASPVHALAYLYGSWPDKLGPSDNSMITILH